MIESHLVEFHVVFARVLIYNLPFEMPKLRSKTHKKEKKGSLGGYHPNVWKNPLYPSFREIRQDNPLEKGLRTNST